MKSLQKTVFGSLASLFFLAGCANNTAPTAEVVTETNTGLPIIGQNVTFDPNRLINNGEPINIEYWTWNDGDAAIPLSEKFMELFPNVHIEVVNNPWQDYWTRLPLSLNGDSGPAIFNIHNSQHDVLIPFLAPYDIPTADLSADFLSVENHIIDGNVYYMDFLINTGNIYYNLDLWEEAGLTDADIPQTWDELRTVAQKLTKNDGRMTQAGFNWNGEVYSAIYIGLNYQQGTLLFRDDNTVNFDNDHTAQNLQFLIDLYEVDGVGSQDFGTESSQSFGNSQSAMTYKWGWFYNELLSNYPDVNFGVFPTPTFTAGTPFAYDRYNGESTPGINKNQSEEQQAVAQEFLRFLLANDDYSKAGALQLASFPTKKSLANNPDIQNHPVLSAIAPRVERLIWPGPFPATVESTATSVMEDVLFNGADLRQTIAGGQARMEDDMRNSSFVPRESSYAFFAEASR